MDSGFFYSVHSAFAMVRNVLVVMSRNTHKQTFTHISHFVVVLSSYPFSVSERKASAAASTDELQSFKTNLTNGYYDYVCHETDDRPCVAAALMRYLHSFPCCAYVLLPSTQFFPVP